MSASNTGAENLSSFHQTQLENYLRFARYKREQHLRDVQAAFTDTKDGLLESHYTQEEVVRTIDGLCSVVKQDVQKELLHVSHTTTLLLQQMFAQAETIMFDLHADTNHLENERLLKEISKFETSSIEREKNKSVKLDPLSKASDAALQHNISKLSEQNKSVQDKFLKIQQQCVEILKEKTKIGEELEKANNQITKLTKKLESLGEKPEVNLQYHEEKHSTEVESLRKKLADTQVELEAAKAELEKRINASTPFVNMKKMLLKKNTTLKQLRQTLAKYEPETAAALEKDDD